VKHGDGIMQQLKPHIYLNGHAYSIFGNSVVCLSRGLQPQLIKEQPVPWRHKVKTFLLQFPGIQDGASANKTPAVQLKPEQSVPKDTHLSTRNRNHHIGPKHDD
jgi:hypothetical protein